MWAALDRLDIDPQGQNRELCARPPTSLFFRISEQFHLIPYVAVIIPSHCLRKSRRSSMLRTGCHWELKRCYRGIHRRHVCTDWRASRFVPAIADQISSSYADNSWALFILYPPITPHSFSKILQTLISDAHLGTYTFVYKVHCF